MAIEIKETRGIFEIAGNLTSQNLDAVRVYFESILETKDKIEIDLKKATSIDGSINLFFQRLVSKATNQGKEISILNGQSVSEFEKTTQKT